MRKVVGQHLFLDTIPNNFIARIGQKVWYDHGMSVTIPSIAIKDFVARTQEICEIHFVSMKVVCGVTCGFEKSALIIPITQQLLIVLNMKLMKVLLNLSILYEISATT